MRALPRRALAAAPAAVLMFALVACGGGSGSDSGSSKSADSQQSAQSSGGAQAEGGAAEEADEKTEPPLSGEVKQKAEAAALAKYPGTVVKSEEDAEKPGMYAVEIQKDDGSTVEVYLDKTYSVTGTKQEGTEENESAG